MPDTATLHAAWSANQSVGCAPRTTRTPPACEVRFEPFFQPDAASSKSGEQMIMRQQHRPAPSETCASSHFICGALKFVVHVCGIQPHRPQKRF